MGQTRLLENIAIFSRINIYDENAKEYISFLEEYKIPEQVITKFKMDFANFMSDHGKQKNLLHEYLKFLDKQKGTDSKINEAIEKIKSHFNNQEQAVLRMQQSEVVRGRCYSLSLCNAVVSDWKEREDALKSWNGKHETLDEKIILPTGTMVARRSLFVEALNYVMPDRKFAPEFIENKASRINFLIPGSNQDLKQSYFEVSLLNKESGKYEIQHTQHYTVAAGTFSKEKLLELLDKNIIADNICLISSSRHTCELSIKNNVWVFYNPNTDKRIAGSKEEIADAILNIIGPSFAIEVASLNAKKQFSFVPTIEKFIESDPDALIARDGLMTIALKSPGILPALLKNASATAKAEAITTVLQSGYFVFTLLLSQPDALAEIYRSASEDKDGDKIRHTIARTLVITDSENLDVVTGKYALFPEELKTKKMESRNETSLHFMIRTSPEALPGLFKLAGNDEILREAITIALTKKNKDGVSGTEALIMNSYAKLYLFDLIKLAVSDLKLQHVLADQLNELHSSLHLPLKDFLSNDLLKNLKTIGVIKDKKSETSPSALFAGNSNLARDKLVKLEQKYTTEGTEIKKWLAKCISINTDFNNPKEVCSLLYELSNIKISGNQNYVTVNNIINEILNDQDLFNLFFSDKKARAAAINGLCWPDEMQLAYEKFNPDSLSEGRVLR